jgi:hypothetical protein
LVLATLGVPLIPLRVTRRRTIVGIGAVALVALGIALIARLALVPLVGLVALLPLVARIARRGVGLVSRVVLAPFLVALVPLAGWSRTSVLIHGLLVLRRVTQGQSGRVAGLAPDPRRAGAVLVLAARRCGIA